MYIGRKKCIIGSILKWYKFSDARISKKNGWQLTAHEKLDYLDVELIDVFNIYISSQFQRLWISKDQLDVQ